MSRVRDFEPARLIMDYIEEERARCVSLIKTIDDRDFLLYCIAGSYEADEIDRARVLYDQMSDPEIEDLM